MAIRVSKHLMPANRLVTLEEISYRPLISASRYGFVFLQVPADSWEQTYEISSNWLGGNSSKDIRLK